MLTFEWQTYSLAAPSSTGYLCYDSFGLAYAAAHPENIAGLILLNGDTFATTRAPFAFKFLIAPGFGELIGRRSNLLATMLLYFGAGRRKHLTPAVMAQ